MRVRLESRSGLLTAGLIVWFLTAGLYIWHPDLLNFVDGKTYDVLLRSRTAPQPSDRVVVVDIDNATLAEYGQWPWPRYRLALLLAKMAKLGVASVGLDMVWPEPDRTSPQVIRRELQRDLKLKIDFTGLPKGLDDYDQVLAGILAQGPFVGGYDFLFEDAHGASRDCTPPHLKAAWLKEPGADLDSWQPYAAQGVICNLPVLAQATSNAGFFNALPDTDGILRRSPLLIRYKNRIYPSLALATVIRAMRVKQIIVKVTSAGVESLRVGRTTVPLGPKGTVLINYAGRRKAFTFIPAKDILADQVKPQALAGKVVFLGTSAAGLLDLRATPLDPVYPGVEVHANIASNILEKSFLLRPSWVPGLELMLLTLATLISFAIISALGPVRCLPVLIIMAGGVWWGSLKTIEQTGFFISPIYFIVNLFLTFTILTLLRFLIENRRKQFFRNAFAHYVSPAVVDELSDTPELLNLAGHDREITLLFSDLRSFTGLSENLESERLGELLRAYFTPMTEIVTAHDGTLDKYIGDAIMAFWNAPLDVTGHQARAILAALEMIERLAELNDSFEAEFGIRLAMGIGLHTGTAMVGNVGSRELFNYTAIGDVVNLASRLEGLTKYFGLPLIFSASVARAAVESDPENDICRLWELGLCRVKGRREPVRLYTALPTAEAESRAAELALFGELRELIAQGRINQAREACARLRNEHSDLGLYRMYEAGLAGMVEGGTGSELIIEMSEK